MNELDPRIRAFFGRDEHPELSWTYLHRDDRAFIESIALAGGDDPGILTAAEYRLLGGDDQRRRLRKLEDWHKAWPYARTQQVVDIERHLNTLPTPNPGLDHELLDVALITGPPGTGKTFLLDRQVVRALCRAAWDRRLDDEDRSSRAPSLVDPDWRPVVYHSNDGNRKVQALFKHLCDAINVPAGTDGQTAFQRAVVRHGIQTVAIDEIQMINFDGQYGMYLHNGIKALQNMNVRVILAGHNVRQKLGRQGTAAQNATQSQSVARWAFLELERYRHETKPQIAEWRALLRKLESRIRLAGHEPGDPVFSKTLEEHLWVTTLGYINALATLITQVCLTAARTQDQLITGRIIDATVLNERVRPGRDQRLRSWRAGLFNWATDAQPEQ